jgi:ribonuclease P protein component
MAEARFPKAHRICKRRDYQRVQRSGIRVPCASFVVLVAAQPTDPECGPSGGRPTAARLGIVASRRVGSAVARNRAKRLVREWFRSRTAELPTRADLVVILRPAAAELDLAQAAAELDAALPEVRRRASRSLARGPRSR